MSVNLQLHLSIFYIIKFYNLVYKKLTTKNLIEHRPKKNLNLI